MVVSKSISEEYYQISEAVLSSFHKYRMPLDLFVLDEKTAQLNPYYKKDSRLNNEQAEKIHTLCHEGNLFVSRADHAVYSQHIVKQLDLVLVDGNLKESEVADIIIRALGLRLSEFMEQPIKMLFQGLLSDCMVFTEYLWADNHRIKLFMRRLHQAEYSLINHSVNTMIIGVWLFMNAKGEELRRKSLDSMALGLLLHDVAMNKVPAFILNKNTPLKQDEKDKIPPHVLGGMQIAQKMELVEEEVRAACLEHHERLDGSGYPQRMKGTQISSMGAMAAVADSFSAMLQKRVYAEAKTPAAAAGELVNAAHLYEKRFSAALQAAFVAGAFSSGSRAG